MNWFLIFLIVVIVVLPAVFDITDYRVAIAEDISSGKLILTKKAQCMLEKGDAFLKMAGDLNNPYFSDNIKSTENDLYRAFIAKVWFERARLEMEINGK